MGRPPGSFLDEHRQPRLIPCAVLYLDLLGVSAMAQGAGAQEELTSFNQAIRVAFRYRIGAQASREPSAIPAAVFSDSFVAATPVLPGTPPMPEADAVFYLVYEAANIQTELAMRGYFVRGAITLGDFHFYDGLVFGPALVEAVELERSSALNPRIILSPRAARVLRNAQAGAHLLGISNEDAPVLVDQDGLAFVNYLERIFEDTEANPASLMRRHRDKVVAKLDTHSADLSKWSKHCWAAEYHNTVCIGRSDVLAPHVDDRDELMIDAIHTERTLRPLV
jgi:hypothetical protein